MNAEVRIYCDEPSHEPKVATIEVYQRIGSGEWRALQHTLRRAERWAAKHEDHEPADRTGGAEVKRLTGRRVDDGTVWRYSRHQLACPLCSFSVPVRVENLWPVLDKLADHGRETIALRSLGARLR